MEYVILTETNISEMEHDVTVALGSGFKLHGPLIVQNSCCDFCHQHHNTTYIQAMTKSEQQDG